MGKRCRLLGAPTSIRSWFTLVLFGLILFVFYLYCGELQTRLNKARQSHPVYKLGCPLAAPNYELGSLLPPEGGKDLPVWGDEVRPLVLANEEELANLIYHLREIHKQVLERFNYNSWDNYIRFYTAYKSSGLDFTSFFDHYQPHFEPRENCIGLALEVLNRANLYLSKQWPNLGSHLYLAACHINISTTWEAGMEKLWDDRASLDHRDSEHVLMDAGIKHTIGALKIEVKGRQGVILFDQGYSWEYPAVLMEDGDSPTFDRIIDKDSPNIHKFRLILDHAYVLWRMVSQADETRVEETHLIYVNRPYCSFLHHTERTDYVRPLRSLVRRDREGKLVGGVFFNMSERGKDGSPQVTTVLLNWDREEKMVGKIPLSHLSKSGMQKNLTSTYDLAFLDTANYLLGLGPDVVIEKLQKIASIFEDEEFIQSCAKMEARLNDKDKAFRRD